jgi:hypothetical protein
MKPSQTLTDHFAPVVGQLCWDVEPELTCWLQLRFGSPYISVREGNPSSPTERGRRRRVKVFGSIQLFFELGEWEYIENGKRRYHSGQSRTCFRRMAQRLQSQSFVRVRSTDRPAETVFEFDLGGEFRTWPSADAQRDDLLWELSNGKNHVRMQANGHLQEWSTK